MATTFSSLKVKGALAVAGVATIATAVVTTLSATTITGTTIKATGSFTGATLQVNDTTGSGAINVYGPDGGGVCFFDLDAGGWTVCSYLNGAQLCSIAAAGYCPRI
jgi:hypothetical protein